MGGIEDVRGRNSFLALIFVVIFASWIAGHYGEKEPIQPKVLVLKTQDNKPAINSGKLIREGGLELVGEYQPRLSNSYRFNYTFTFNKAVSANEAESYFEFKAKNGAEVNAKVESLSERPEKLRVSPVRLLEGDQEWQLVLRKGLPSVEGNDQLGKGKNWKLGRRNPVAVAAVSAVNQLNQKRAIHIELSHAVQRNLKGEDISRWVQVEQKTGSGYVPVNFKCDSVVQWNKIILSGPFSLNLSYRVLVKPGLPSRLGLTLEKEWEQKVSFEPLPGRVYLADTATSQSVHGNRFFGFVSVNNQSIRLRVKRVDPEQGFKVIQSYYRKYLGRGDFRWSGNRWKQQKSQSLEYELIPGEEVHSKVYSVRGKTDEALKLEFQWDDILSDVSPGILFVNVESMGVDHLASSAQSLIQLTDIGVFWKESGGSKFFHAFSLKTGEPLQGVQLKVMESNGKQLVNTEANGEGNVSLDLPTGRDALWVELVKGGDQHTLQLGTAFAEMPLWSYNINHWSFWREEEKMHLFSDRMVYQPGETVLLKGHVRVWKDGSLGLPESQEYDVRVTGPRRRVYHRQKISSNKNGSFDLAIDLPSQVHGSFEIQVGPERIYVDALEYEPATFNVRLKGERKFSAGQTVEVPVRARYYFGKPLAAAKMKWSFRGRYGHRWSGRWKGYRFGTGNSEGEVTLSGELETNSEGEALIRPELPAVNDKAAPLQGDLFVQITDINGQSFSEHASIIRHSSDFYIGVSDFPAVQRIGAPLSFSLVAVRPEGDLYHSGIPVEVELSRVEWRTVKVKGAGGGVRFHNKKHLIFQKKVELKTGNRESKPILTDLVPKEAGQYQLSFRSVDSSGHSVLTQAPLYVSGNQSLAWDYHTEFKLDLIPDSKLYEVGQTAQVLLKAPFSGRALVTVERDRVLRSFQVNVSGNAPRIEVPLMEGDAPNVYVSVLLLRGAQGSLRKIPTAEYRLGYCEIIVESPASRLEVSARLEKADYQPGQEAETSVYVSNGQGDPQEGVEVTLYAVDEGVLDLTGYQSPDLHAFFYKPMPLEVKTASSIPFMRTEDPRRVHYANKGHIIGGGGDAGRLRRNFQAVAFWSASLLTDKEGKVQASFIVPDSLTSYRVFAVAHKEAGFGSAEARFRVRLPLMVESALPRFARIGDHLIAKAMVYNQTSQAQSVSVSLETDDLIQIGLGSQQKITVPPNASVAVRYPLNFVGQGKSRTVWRVTSETSSDLKDSRESYIDILHVSPLRKSVHFYRSKENIDDLLKSLAPELREADGVYEISACTSAMAEMEAASEYLLDYPHGCAEQTGSRLLPWLLLEEYRDVLPRLNLDTGDQQENPVEHGINRLLSMQTHEGGLAYWPGGTADGFASSYGGMVLAIAVKKGKKVPSEAMDRLAGFLVRLIKRPVKRDSEWGVHCLALYTLALMDKSQPAYHENAFSVRAKLPSAALSLLTSAVAESSANQKMLSDLRETTGTSAKAFRYYGNSSQRLAMRLLSKGEGNGSASIAGRLSQLSREGHWGSTFANAWVVYAMTRFDQRSSKSHPVKAVVEFGGKEYPVSLDRDHRKKVIRLESHPGPMRFRFLSENTDNLVYLTVRSAVRPVGDPSDTINRGLVVQREYSRMNPEGNSENEVPMRVGDLVKVEIKMNVMNEDVHYLAIEDGLPASLEPVFTRLKSQMANVRANYNWRIDHHELRKDRAVFYVNHPRKGEYIFEYIARVRAEGSVAAPPVKAEAMYDPDIMGLSAWQKLITRSIND